uniref:Uncharacterized protein n=1 Tax=Oryza brachyantha TaxID=4533 RepID=J3M7L1_ORYBR
MAPPRPLFDLNEPPPEDDIEDDASTACESSQSRSGLEVYDGMGDGSTARGLPSPPSQEDESTGDALPEGELLFPVFDLDAPLSPLDDDDDDDEEEDGDLTLEDLPRSPDDPDGGRSTGTSCSSVRMANDRSKVSHPEAAGLTTPCSHADDGVDMHGTGPVDASPSDGISPRASLPDCHDMKTLSPAFPVRSSSENSASRFHGIGEEGTMPPYHMPQRHKQAPVPRHNYGEDSGMFHGGSHGAGSRHHERSMRSHQGIPRSNRRWRPMRRGENGHDQIQLVYNGHDQMQRIYNNVPNQCQQMNNGRDRRQLVYNNDHDGRHQVFYSNGHDQRQQAHHGNRWPDEGYQVGQGRHHGYAGPNRQ